ncbi:ABC transporter permease [Euzebya sp.]|uniref:ABC transporter permease n=1 Tax=Euzebya sp. TaxID=1971409 RepID=UPI0035197D2B
MFVWVGLVARGAQAAQGLGLLAVPLAFLSSAFVPVDTLPAVLRTIAEVQPLTMWIDATRGLLLGDAITATLEHGLGVSVVGSLVWALVLVAVAAPSAVRAYRRD